MMDMAVLEQENASLMNVSRKIGAPSDEALENRIEALKELTLVLFRQVEALAEKRSLDITRRSINLYDEVRRFETEIIRYALLQTGGHQSRAAHLLGVKITTLNAKIKRYNIPLDPSVNDTTDLSLLSKGVALEGI